MRFPRYGWAVVIVVVLAVVLGTYLALRQPQEAAYRIGADLPLTGPVSYVAQQLKNGMELAAAEINAGGGINGKKLEIIYQDNQLDPKQSVTAFRQLQLQYRVPVVISSHSPTSMPLRPLAEEARVLLVSVVVSYPRFTENYTYVGRDFVASDLESQLIADFMFTQRKSVKAGILHVNDDYGHGAADAFKKRFESLGGAVVADEEFAQEETNFRSTLTKMYSKNPDGIYLIGREQSFAAAIVQMRETQFGGDIVTCISLNSQTVMKQLGSAAEGVYFSNIEYFPDSPTTDKMKAFVSAYQQKYGDAHNYICVYGYDIVSYLAAAIRDGGYSSDGIRKALVGKKLDLVRGSVVVPPNLDIQTPLHIAQVKDGKFRVVFRPKGSVE